MSELTDTLSEIREIFANRILNYKRNGTLDSKNISITDIESISSIDSIISDADSGGGNGGDATAENQEIQNQNLEAIAEALSGDSVANIENRTLAILYSLKDGEDNNFLAKILETTGNIFAPAASSDTGNWSITELFKRLLFTKLNITLSDFRDAITTALLNQSKTISVTTTLNNTGIYDVTVTNYSFYKIVYVVSNISSPISLKIEGGINGKFDNLSNVGASISHSSNGTYSLRGDARALNTLRINYTGTATVEFNVGYQ